MTDRLVRELTRNSKPSETRRFSEFLCRPNVVLLGDPGAGKTHLFRRYASETGSLFMSVRDFLNVASEKLVGRNVVFLDALDERRAGRGDDTVIDALVSKLGRVGPVHVRLSCRMADWLGETDLSALEAVFASSGGVSVIALETLSRAEQREILQGAAYPDADSFLKEAASRGLERLLENPQTLLMLGGLVENGSWPANRSELYRQSLDLLLSEHNGAHKRRKATAVSAQEIRDAAGAACTLRLVSDIKGFSLDELADRDDCPSYNEITLAEPAHLLAALGTRVFTADAATESVDYLHRTIAEHAAAHWLVDRVRGGIPIGRIRRLLGFQGRPASELRGLHAWLAVLTPEHSAELIDADPFGTLTYGDASALSTNLRVHLLGSLGRLADIDPWFRGGYWDAPITGLAGPDMVGAFRTILADRSAAHGLRSVILDSLTIGAVVSELQGVLIELLVDSDSAVSERLGAISALRTVGELGLVKLAEAYERIANAPDDLRIRAEIIRAAYGHGLGATQVAGLLESVLGATDELPLGVLGRLDRAVPERDIALVLNAALSSAPEPRKRIHNHNVTEVLDTFDRLLAKYLGRDDAEASDVLRWLLVRKKFARYLHHGGSSEKLKGELGNKTNLRTAILDALLREADIGASVWKALNRIDEVTLGVPGNSEILDRVLLALVPAQDARQLWYYELALNLTFRAGASAVSTFEELYELGNERDLRTVRESCCSWEIPDWRVEDSNRKTKASEEQRAARAANRARFEADQATITSGSHLGWMQFLGNVYFCRFSDLDEDLTPAKRVAAALGESNAPLALQSLVTFARAGRFSTLEEVLDIDANGRYCQWWYASIAGLSELAMLGSVIEVDEVRLRAALAIDRLHPTHARVGNTIHECDHEWKKELLKVWPQIVAETYEAIVRHSLRLCRDHVPGLYELTHDEALRAVQGDIALRLLREFPTAPAQPLHALVREALQSEPEALKGLVPTARAACQAAACHEAWRLWTAVGLVLAVSGVVEEIQRLDETEAKAMVWQLRDVAGYQRWRKEKPLETSLAAMTFIVTFAGARFPWAQHPDGGWSGDTNPWDAAEFVIGLVHAISGIPTAQAAGALAQMANDPNLVSYRSNVLHALAEQRVLYTDANFRQVGWRDSLTILSGGPPVDVADLQELAIQHLRDVGAYIASANTDPYKRFWNLDRWGRLESPKPEEPGRDALIDLLRPKFSPLGVRVEPEGHMAADKRADVAVTMRELKLVMEVKRDSHPDLWSAPLTQLHRFYMHDPEAKGYGIYCVLWFGSKRTGVIPHSPDGQGEPTSVDELQGRLQASVPAALQSKLRAIVLDVSGPCL